MSATNKPLRFYHDSWWKVEGEPIWLLAGRDTETDRNLMVGWYFSDQTGEMIGPYEHREDAENALDNHS